MTEVKTDNQVGLYKELRPRYQAFAEALQSLLIQLLSVKGIDIVAVEARAKAVRRFKEKIEREEKDYSDPINQVTDLAGVRIIAYQNEDVERICELIVSSFEVDENNSVDKRKIIEADRFGYLSVHYVVSIDKIRSQLPEYDMFCGLRGEIQIRTVLQHAWAAIDHKLRYKSKEEIPAHLRRQLYRIGALLETADAEFESLTENIAKIRQQYTQDIEKGSLDIPLDLDSLSVYFNSNARAKKILDTADKIGFSIAPHHPKSNRPEYSSLLFLLNNAGIKTISEFDKVLEAITPGVEEVLSKINNYWGKKVGDPKLRLVMTKDSLMRTAFLFGLPPEPANDLFSYLRYGETLRAAIEDAYRDLHDRPAFAGKPGRNGQVAKRKRAANKS